MRFHVGGVDANSWFDDHRNIEHSNEKDINDLLDV